MYANAISNCHNQLLIFFRAKVKCQPVWRRYWLCTKLWKSGQRLVRYNAPAKRTIYLILIIWHWNWILLEYCFSAQKKCECFRQTFSRYTLGEFIATFFFALIRYLTRFQALLEAFLLPIINIIRHFIQIDCFYSLKEKNKWPNFE
jgi:hypothetical protein